MFFLILQNNSKLFSTIILVINDLVWQEFSLFVAQIMSLAKLKFKI